LSERLQKLLAAAGLGSRRGIEEWIRAGRIAVNGRLATLGDRAAPGDRITLDGQEVRLAAASPVRVLLYHKPLGEVTTRSDPQGRPTVFARLPPVADGRWIVIGRLDVNTSGLLLFTTDGALAHQLMHPSSEIEREYLVRLRGTPSASVLEQLRRGVMLEDGPARFDRIEHEQSSTQNSSLRVTLHEGRNREVRRLFEQVGHEVSRLLRVRYGTVVLPRELRAGQFRELDAREIEPLRALCAGQSVSDS
jgi:23S rRNA pseudouridine2605 synthase